MVMFKSGYLSETTLIQALARSRSAALYVAVSICHPADCKSQRVYGSYGLLTTIDYISYKLISPPFSAVIVKVLVFISYTGLASGVDLIPELLIKQADSASARSSALPITTDSRFCLPVAS